MRHGLPPGLVPGAPRSLYPNMPDVEDAGDEARLNREYMERLFLEFKRSLQSYSQYFVDRTNRVDEYRVESLGGESLTTTSVLPDYECDEVIESVLVNGPTQVQGVGQPAEGSQTSPAAGTTIASVLVGPGTYSVSWEVSLGGTVAAADANNFQLTDGTKSLTSVNPAAAGGPYPQETEVFVEAGAIATIAVKNIALATTGAIYSAQMVVTPVVTAGTPFTLQLGKRAWQMLLPPTGILVIAPVAVKLGRSDTRQLIGSIPGDWSFELMGYAETGRRGIV